MYLKSSRAGGGWPISTTDGEYQASLERVNSARPKRDFEERGYRLRIFNF